MQVRGVVVLVVVVVEVVVFSLELTVVLNKGAIL